MSSQSAYSRFLKYIIFWEGKEGGGGEGTGFASSIYPPCPPVCTPTPSIGVSSGNVDETTTSSTKQFTLSNAKSQVSWSVTGNVGTGGGISGNGLLTTGSNACGSLVVTATDSCCGDFTQEVRITNNGYWFTTDISYCYLSSTYTNNCYTAPVGKIRYLDYYVNTYVDGGCGLSTCAGGRRINRRDRQEWRCIP